MYVSVEVRMLRIYLRCVRVVFNRTVRRAQFIQLYKSVTEFFLSEMSASPAKTAAKPKKPGKPAAHPKYNDMICTAVGALKERTGSSRQAIIKYIKANYKVRDNSSVHVRMALKRMVISQKLVQTKGSGASGRFKLSDAAKAKKKVEKKKPAAKKPKKKTAAKKEKKSAAKTTKSKKPAAKKTKKPAAKKPAAKSKKPAAKKPAAKKPAKKAEKKPAAKKTTKKTAKK